MPHDLPFSTCPPAIRAYRRGVGHLLDGDPRAAARALRDAVEADPTFVVGHAGLAVALSDVGGAVSDEAVDAVSRARGGGQAASRWERHHVEVVALALGGQCPRATVLGREHLAELPTDAVVRHVLRRWCGQRDLAAISA